MDENSNIDNFFKERLESQEFPFQDADWILLEKRLDSSVISASGSGSVFSTIKTIIIVAVIITMAFILGWFARDMFKKDSTGGVLLEKAEPAQITIQNINNNYIPVSEDPKSERIEQNWRRNGNDIKRANTFHVAFDKNINAAGSPDKGVSRPTNKKDELIYLSPNIVTAEKGKAENSQTHLVSGPDSDTLRPLDLLPAKINSGISADYIPDYVKFSHTEDIQLAAKNHIPFRGRWMFGISVAPDFNSVGIFSEKTVSAKVGGQLYYLISPRWFLSTGVLYNNKKYNTGAEYYKPPDGYWLTRTNGIIPDNILGSCRVIDIPITITYQFAQKGIVTFTASAGVSSYILLDEKYSFEFSRNNPGAANGWQSNEHTLAAFNMANVALGAEVRTTQRLFLAVEPFLKIPLKEIGWGNVELYSVGMLCTLKYRLWVH